MGIGGELTAFGKAHETRRDVMADRGGIAIAKEHQARSLVNGVRRLLKSAEIEQRQRVLQPVLNVGKKLFGDFPDIVPGREIVGEERIGSIELLT